MRYRRGSDAGKPGAATQIPLVGVVDFDPGAELEGITAPDAKPRAKRAGRTAKKTTGGRPRARKKKPDAE